MVQAAKRTCSFTTLNYVLLQAPAMQAMSGLNAKFLIWRGQATSPNSHICICSKSLSVIFISLGGLWHIAHMYIRQTFPNADKEYTGYEKEED